MQNVVGPALVAMATTFGLGAEIQSPTGLEIITAGDDLARTLFSRSIKNTNRLHADVTRVNTTRSSDGQLTKNS